MVTWGTVLSEWLAVLLSPERMGYTSRQDEHL